MAITIEQSPVSLTPAYNDVIFVISSTNSGNTNFKYVVDIVVSGNTHRLTIFPHPSFGTAYVNIGKILETYVSTDLNDTTYGWQTCPNSFERYEVQFGEQYGNPVVVFPNLTNTSATNFIVWSGVFNFLEFQDYIGAGIGSLTNKPATTTIRDDENTWLYAIGLSSGVIHRAEVITKDIAGSTLQSLTIQNPFVNSDIFDSNVVRFGCGTRNINLIPNGDISIGSQPIITASVASYTVEVLSTLGSVIVPVQTYNINNECTRNNLYRFHFLVTDGGFDSFTFYRADTKRVSIQRDSYKKNAASLTAADTYGYEIKARTSIAYNTRLKDNISVLSDWITEDESEWLEELITSPEVYLDDPTHGLVSVNIKDNSYDIKQVATDKLFNLRISFEYGYDRFRQRY
jgi:hypothetical protein